MGITRCRKITKMPGYQKGKIYKILNTIDNEIYVGSTCETLSQRMARHRSLCRRNNTSLIYKHMNQLGVEHFYIELIEDCPCDRNEELIKREGEIIRSIGTLNKCGKINIKDNPDYIKHYKAIWYERNIESAKEYYEQNKEHIIAKQKILNNKYYEQNKDKDKQNIINKKYYEQDKDTITNNIVECECGCIMNFKSLARHKTTTKHKQLLANQIFIFDNIYFD